MRIIRQIQINYKGLVLSVNVTSFSPARPAPFAQTPGCPGYDDSGDPGEVDFEVVGVMIGSEKAVIKELSLDADDEGLSDMVYQGMGG